MPGTKEGAAKLVRTNIATYGSMEAYKQFMRDIGSKGGRNGNTGGFALTLGLVLVTQHLEICSDTLREMTGGRPRGFGITRASRIRSSRSTAMSHFGDKDDRELDE